MSTFSLSIVKNSKGAALVEYVVLLVGLGIVLPGIVLFGDKVPELFTDPPGLEIPTDTPELVIEIPSCVETGQCAPPTEVFDYCIANTNSGEFCDIVGVVVIKDPDEDPFVVSPNPDPELEYAVSSRNEDFPDPVYANQFANSASNQADIMAHTANYSHPGGEYCAGQGGILPSVVALRAMAPYAASLNLAETIYLSSSQYWAAGGYNPPPVLVSINYASNFDFGKYRRGQNPVAHGFIEHKYFVRCIFRGE